MKTKNLIFISGFITLFLVLGIISYDKQVGRVTADTQPNMSGWAWSDNIGWISFSWLNGGPGPVYGISVAGDTSGNLNGQLSGYAWSDNIGWISFQCNVAPGTGECFADGEAYPSGGLYRGPAKIENNVLKGWARACSVFASGCRGALKSDEARGGWDGWISLAGANPDYDVTYYPGSTAGAGTFGRFGVPAHSFAWGDTNLGWISFQPRDPSLCVTDPSKCGVILGQPKFSAYCRVEDDGQSPARATWRVYPSGGSGSYTYKWIFQDLGASCGPSDSGFTSSYSKATICQKTGTGSTGKAEGKVQVRDGVNPNFETKNCTNIKGGTGVTVNIPVPSFSINGPGSVSAIFQGGEKATTTPVAIITVVPTINPLFNKPVTLSVESIDSLTLANLGNRITASDVVFQFSEQTVLPNTNWTYSSRLTVRPDYAPVSLLIHFKKRPAASSFVIEVKGESPDGLIRKLPITVNIDKGTSGVQEQ